MKRQKYRLEFNSTLKVHVVLHMFSWRIVKFLCEERGHFCEEKTIQLNGPTTSLSWRLYIPVWLKKLFFPSQCMSMQTAPFVTDDLCFFKHCIWKYLNWFSVCFCERKMVNVVHNESIPNEHSNLNLVSSIFYSYILASTKICTFILKISYKK